MVRCSRQQSRSGMAKSAVNGQAQYTPGFQDTCYHHDDEVRLKYGDAEYHSDLQRRPMNVQHCDHVTSPPRAAANGCAMTLTEVNRNSYG